MTRSVVQVRLSEAEKALWIENAGRGGLSEFIRSVVGAATRGELAWDDLHIHLRVGSLADREAREGLAERVEGVGTGTPDGSSAAPRDPAPRSASPSVCSLTGFPPELCLCRSCKEARGE